MARHGPPLALPVHSAGTLLKVAASVEVELEGTGVVAVDEDFADLETFRAYGPTDPRLVALVVVWEVVDDLHAFRHSSRVL